MFYKIMSVFSVILSIIQFYTTVKAYRFIKTEGGQNTSPFILYALWFSLVLAVMFLTVGISGIKTYFFH